jgi:DNA-binding transcriptional LysR family regulator
MDWDKLRIFNAAARAGSFTNAGTALNLSQSAISRQVTALEQDLKTFLFHRHARGLKLTEQGEILHMAVQEVIARVSMAEATLAEHRDRPAGELKISCSACFGAFWLAPRLSEFHDLYPEISLTLLFDGGDANLGMREADVAVRIGCPDRSSLVQRRLLSSRLFAYAAPSYIKARGLPEQAEELDGHQLVVHQGMSGPAIDGSNWLLHAGANPAERRRPIATLDTIHGVLHAIRSGLGIGALPHFIDPESAGLIRVLPDVVPPKIDAYFVYAPELRHSKRVVVFRDFLLRKIAEDRLQFDPLDQPLPELPIVAGARVAPVFRRDTLPV